MTAFRDGIRRVNDAPAILLGTWLLMVAVSVPLTFAMRGAGATGSSRLPPSPEASADWLREFADQASGVGVRLQPAIVGFDALLDRLGMLADDARGPFGIVGVSYLALWLFLAGGILDRYARERPTRAHGFFAAAGTFFFRFLRLGVVLGLVYWGFFVYVRPQLPGGMVSGVVVAAALALGNLLVDYAQVRAVVEDRRSMIGSLIAAGRFLAAHAGAAISLYVADVALFIVVVAIYDAAAPVQGGAGLALWSGFVAGQIYVFARIWVRLVFWASEVSLFQSRLAHAGYVATPARSWPESPSAEAISRDLRI